MTARGGGAGGEDAALRARYPTMFEEPAMTVGEDAVLLARYPSMFEEPAPVAADPTLARYPSMAPTPEARTQAEARAALEAADARALGQRYPQMAVPRAAGESDGGPSPGPEAEVLAARYPRMDPSDPVRQALAAPLAEVTAAYHLGAEEAGVLHDNAVGLARDLGVTSTAAGELVGLYAQHVTAPPDEATEAAWRHEATTAAIQRYGERGAQARHAKVHAYLQAHPAVLAALEATGLGSHPRVVELFFEAADRLPGGRR